MRIAVIVSTFPPYRGGMGNMARSYADGLVGIGLGWAGAVLISNLQDNLTAVVTPQSVLLATGFSLAVGLFFGIYPATRAAGLNPIDALRYE